MKLFKLLNKLLRNNINKRDSCYFLCLFNRLVSIIIVIVLLFSLISFKTFKKNNKVDPDNPGGGPTFELKIPATNNKKAIP